MVKFLISKILIHYHSSWPSGQGQKNKRKETKGVPTSNDDIVSVSYIAVYIPVSELRLVISS